MDNGIANDNFDKFLARVGKGFTLDERKKVNKAGDKVYEEAMQNFLNSHKSSHTYLKGTQHLADTLTHEIREDGHYEIGFSRKGKKAYVARLLNDGWRPRNQYGGPYGEAPKGAKYAEWHDFIARIGSENDHRMGSQMAHKAKEIMDRKAGV